MDVETIKSYLVSLGMQVNESDFQKGQKALKDLNTTIVSLTTGMAKDFAVAGTAMVGTLAAITTATAGLVKSTADLDMQYQKFALRMWMSKDSAKDLQVTLKAMGESIEDVAFIPELRQQYFQLLNQGQQMRTPDDASGQLKYIRSIMFEFKRLKLEISYAAEWISYYLIKYLSGPLAKAKESLQGFNQLIVQNMPKWTNTVAKILSMIVMLFVNVGRFLHDTYVGFEQLFMMLPKGIRVTITALMALFTIMRMNPFIAGFGAMILLIDDFYAYVDGRKSLKSLAPIWQKLIDWSKEFNDSMETNKAKLDELWDSFMESDFAKTVIDELKDKIEELAKSTGKLANETLKALDAQFSLIFDKISSSLDKNGVWPSLITSLNEVDKAFNSIILGLTNIMKQFGLLTDNPKYRNFWSFMGDQIASSIKQLAAFTNIFARLAQAIGLAAQGNWLGAGKLLLSIPDQFVKEMRNSYQHGGSSRDWNSGFNLGPVVNIQDLADRIGQAESGGRYDAEGDTADNMGGKYQILRSNWPSWAEEAGLGRDAPYTPENQDIVAQYKMQQMFDSYKAQGYSNADAYRAVAGEWNGGGAAGESAARYGHWGGEAGNYPALIAGMEAMPTSFNSLSSLAQNGLYNMQQGSASYLPTASAFSFGNAGEGNIYIDAINLSFGGTNATLDQIKQATIDGLQQATGKQVARQARDLQGILV